MFSAIGAFLAGVLLSWPALIVLVLLGILFEHNGARGWAVATALAVAALCYFYFSIPLTTIFIGIGVYVVVGLLWSFWRYKRHADKIVAANINESQPVKQRAIERLHPAKMWDTIVAWVLIWPFSMVENVIGDILNAVYILVKKVFRGVYQRIYNSAVSALMG